MQKRRQIIWKKISYSKNDIFGPEFWKFLELS